MHRIASHRITCQPRSVTIARWALALVFPTGGRRGRRDGKEPGIRYPGCVHLLRYQCASVPVQPVCQVCVLACGLGDEPSSDSIRPQTSWARGVIDGKMEVGRGGEGTWCGTGGTVNSVVEELVYTTSGGDRIKVARIMQPACQCLCLIGHDDRKV